MRILSLLAALAASGFAATIPTDVAPAANAQADSAAVGCKNSPSNRACWGKYNISTDYYDIAPDTGITRTYNLEITNNTVAPDGVKRIGFLINGQMPGPTIWANWGDNIVVNIKNSLQNNGTSIHFHGMTQKGTNQNDGVASITQCPIAPGASYTHKFRATQYGTSWYHAHWALQAWMGVFGPIVIDGPATANYDADLGPLVMQDWSHQTVDQMYHIAETPAHVIQDTGLLNGMNVWKNKAGGKNYTTSVTPGKSYRLRLICGAIDSYFKFSIDNHVMTVIANDFVPIKPYNTTVLTLGIGQRYDVIIHANQKPGNYWMRAIPADECSDSRNFFGINGILRYDNKSTALPTSTSYDIGGIACDDEPMASLVPYLDHDANKPTSEKRLGINVYQIPNGLYKWSLGGTSMMVPWENPTLLQLSNNVSQMSWPKKSAVIDLPKPNVWSFYVIETQVDVTHPMHLHGHDFYILAQGKGNFSSDVPLQTNNPPRRDTATVPRLGYLVIGFETDNPGAWLMHCHVGWHQSEGLTMQFVERQSEIVIDRQVLDQTCKPWNDYVKANMVVEEDSGI